MKVEGTNVTLTNSGSLPAVAAHVLRPSHLDTFTADDNYFWLEPGESRLIIVNDSQGLTAGAWNAGKVEPSGPRASAKEQWDERLIRTRNSKSTGSSAA
jgi:hypothetical protein